MSFRDKLRAKFDVKVATVKSRAKSIDQQITETIENQLAIAHGDTVLGANGKPMKSWRNDKGEVSIKIGVLPFILDDDGKAETYQNVSVKDYQEMVADLKYCYGAGELDAEVEDLKRRKAAADKKAAESRKKNKTENRDGLS